MIAKLRRAYLNILFVGVGVFLVYASLLINTRGASFAISARFVPLMLSSIMLGLAAWMTVSDFMKDENAPTVLTLRALRTIGGFLAFVLGFVLLMGTINFFVLTFLFLVVSFFYLGVRSATGIALGALSLVAAHYAVFDIVFRVVFP